MTKIVYNKLVRDSIPEILRAKGKRFQIHVADENEYYTKLMAKLREEVDELLEYPCIEELADVYEVLSELSDKLGYNQQDINEARIKKNHERGAFKKKYILESVSEE